MAANARPWDIRLWLYPGANPAGDAAGWGLEEDISDKIRHAGALGGQPITYSAGRQDEAARVDFGQMALTLDNTDGRFSTDNVNGPWWGSLSRGTPIRLGVVAGHDTFTRSVVSGLGTAESGNTWSASSSTWSVNGTAAVATFPTANAASQATMGDGAGANFDTYFTCWSPVIATGGPFIFSGIQLRDTSNYMIWRVELGISGGIQLKISRVGGAGTAELVATGTIPGFTYAINEKIRVRCQRDGASLRIKAWKAVDPEPAAWTATATDTSLPSGELGIHAWRFVANTNAGSQTMLFDDVQIIGTEFTGSVVEWPVRWDMTGRNSWAPIKAAGILRRLAKTKTGSLQSPLRRQLPFHNPTGYWPLEDGENSTSLASVVAGQRPATIRDVRPAADNTLVGGGPAVTMNAVGAVIQGQTNIPQHGTGFSAMFFSKIPTPPAGPTLYRIARFYTSRGAIVRWDVLFNATDMSVQGYNGDGVLVVNQVAGAGVDITGWVAWQLETQVVGANTEWSLLVHQVGETTFWTVNGSYVSSTNSLIYSFSLGGIDVAHLVGASFAHVWLGPNTLPFVDDTFSKVSSGYTGELAADRIARVCAEAGIPVIVEPGASEPLGPQRGTRALDVVRAAEEADFGVLYEQGNGLGFRPRTARYNQPVLMSLSVAAGQISEPPEPTNDDQRVKNAITVTRDGGSSAVYRDEDHIAREGEYEDTPTINVETDGVLPHHAAWRGHLGTTGAMRWPGIVLDFARNPGLIPKWRQKTHGFRLAVVTGRPQVAGNDPDVIAEGYTAELTPHVWKARLACSMAKPWTAGVADDTGILGRADTAGCQTTALLTTTGTSIAITTTLGPVWDTTAGIYPMDLNVGGERITISGITGAGPAQTATVAAGGRSKNGVVKSHPSGTKVSLWDPAIAAL